MQPEPVRLSWAERVSLWLYGLVMCALQPVLRRKLKRRAREEPGYLSHVEQRFGFYDGVPGSSGGLWIHAVSLGETRAAGLLLTALREQLPGVRILLTHGTATGRAAGVDLLREGDVQVWQPWDTPGAVQRFLAHFQPLMGVMLETEVWPNWVQACVRHRTPLYLVNARLNDTSLRRAQRLRWLSRPAYRGFSAVLAQTVADAQRLARLGARVGEKAYGNLKFDVEPQCALIEQGRAWKRALAGRRVVMLASSREGEEEMWLQALRRVQPDASMLWLVVPRHPQRFREVEVAIQSAGLSVCRRSEWQDHVLPSALSADVWLGDSLGEMQAYYTMADLAWLGGSFMPLGGQNLIEAAVCECPVIMGPHTFNFADVAEQAQQAGAALRVADMPEALRETMRCLANEDALDRARRGGRALLQQGRGAAQRYAACLAHSYRQHSEKQ